jgi:hypothetical protein
LHHSSSKRSSLKQNEIRSPIEIENEEKVRFLILQLVDLSFFFKFCWGIGNFKVKNYHLNWKTKELASEKASRST